MLCPDLPASPVPEDASAPEDGSARLREELLSRILQRKRSFSETAGKRYLLYLARLMTSAGAVLEGNADHVRLATEAFQHGVARRLDSHYIGRLLAVMKAVIEEASRDPGLGFLPGPQAEAIASAFLEELTAVFTTHAAHAMSALDSGITSQLHGYAARFRGDMEPRVRRLNLDMVELYCLMHRSLQQDFCSNDGEDCKDTVPQLLDAFGRGLMHPVDRYYGIEACSLEEQDAFPRLLCGPVLQALRGYSIGVDKYDATNKKFIQSIYKYCAKESEFHRACLSEYFEEPHVRQYLVAYLVHILNLFCEETKREAFTLVVSARLKEQYPEEDYEFSPMHRSRLLTAWARYCLDNIASLKGRKRVLKIVQVHLPGMDLFLPEGLEEETV